MNSLSFYAQVIIGNELWVSNTRFNGLFKINIESGKIMFIGRFPQYNPGDEELHLFAKKYGHKLYFFPKCSKNIDIYDLKTEKFTYIECKKNHMNGYATTIGAFCSGEDRVLTVPCYSNMPLQEFSIKKETLIESFELKKLNQNIKNTANAMVLYACKMHNEIFYPIHGTNQVGSYNLRAKKEKIYSINRLKRILGDIAFDGHNIWINADQAIYQWNPNNGSLKLACDCLSEKEGWIEQFIIYNQNIICIPRWLNNIKIINIQTFTYKEVHIDKSKLSININMPWRDVKESFVWRDYLIISPIKYKEAVFINLNNNEIKYKCWEGLEALPVQEDFFIHEKWKEDLQDYIMTINNNKKIIRKINNSYIGHDILQKIESIID